MARDTLPKNIGIVTNVDSELPALYGDPTQCHQVLLNLCVNARDAMPDGGTLTLSANISAAPAQLEAPRESAGTKFVVFHVEDSGDGIPAHLLDKIFDPFFTTKEAGKGTGLGLSTSLTIVRSHGGHMTVDSEVTRGTRFDVYLPLAPKSSSWSAAEETKAIPHGTGQIILVVDDEESVRRVLKATLEHAGYQVLQAANGKEALAVYHTSGGTIAAVIIDMTMPVLGGVPTMRELVKMNTDVRIIAASGIHENEKVAKAVGGQVKQFLTKPFTAEVLLRAVAGAVAGS
jgi:CheY-like chemotaxis protein